jgi:hypothetical protein
MGRDRPTIGGEVIGIRSLGAGATAGPRPPPRRGARRGRPTSGSRRRDRARERAPRRKVAASRPPRPRERGRVRVRRRAPAVLGDRCSRGASGGLDPADRPPEEVAEVRRRDPGFLAGGRPGRVAPELRPDRSRWGRRGRDVPAPARAGRARAREAISAVIPGPGLVRAAVPERGEAAVTMGLAVDAARRVVAASRRGGGRHEGARGRQEQRRPPDLQESRSVFGSTETHEPPRSDPRGTSAGTGGPAASIHGGSEKT